MTTLRQSMEKYIEKRSYRRISTEKVSQSNVEGLLTGKMPKDKTGEERKPFPFTLTQQDGISGYLDMDIVSHDVTEALPLAIIESVKAYNNKKPKVVKIYQDFITFLEREYGVKIPIAYPYLYSNEFDRQMFIVKELHEKDRSIAHLEERLWTGSKTIDEDLKQLQTPGAVRILGQDVTIDGICKGDGVVRFESTVHPIFLTTTVEQVIALLDGLRLMSKNPAFTGHVLPLVSSIWEELSDYGKNRIFELIDSLGLDRHWYEQLPYMEKQGLFRTEVQCSSDIGVGNVLDFLKNRKMCSLTYTDKGKECQLSNVRIVDLDDGHIIATKDGISHKIRFESITLTTYKK